jgi:hypothetical protein
LVEIAASRNEFFRNVSVVALIYAVVGFSPSFILRPLFQPVVHGPSPPWYYYVHGGLMLAWLVLLVVQTSLVSAQRTDLHGRTGVYGVVLSIAVLISMLVVTLELPHQYRVDPVRQLRTPFQSVVQVVWLNLAGIPLFATFTFVVIVPALLIVHDLHTLRRLHPATIWGVGCILLLGSMLPVAIAGLRAGRALVAALQ